MPVMVRSPLAPEPARSARRPCSLRSAMVPVPTAPRAEARCARAAPVPRRSACRGAQPVTAPDRAPPAAAPRCAAPAVPLPHQPGGRVRGFGLRTSPSRPTAAARRAAAAMRVLARRRRAAPGRRLPLGRCLKLPAVAFPEAAAARLAAGAAVSAAPRRLPCRIGEPATRRRATRAGLRIGPSQQRRARAEAPAKPRRSCRRDRSAPLALPQPPVATAARPGFRIGREPRPVPPRRRPQDPGQRAPPVRRAQQGPRRAAAPERRTAPAAVRRQTAAGRGYRHRAPGWAIGQRPAASRQPVPATAPAVRHGAG